MIGIISLEGLEFHSYHGLYEKEKKHGNTFTVDIHIKADLEKPSLTDSIQHTIDYVEVYKIVKNEMEIPSRLLENVVRRIQDKLIDRFPQMQSLTVSLSKDNPPIGGACKRTKVTISKDFQVS